MSDRIFFRKTLFSDMNDVMDVHRRSIRELCVNDYNKAQISAWSNVNYSKEIWMKSMNEDWHFVIIQNEKIEGFCHACLREGNLGEIEGLYFSKEVSGKGYGREIVLKALSYLKENNCHQIIVSATKTAKTFYEKMGFVAQVEKLVDVRGTRIISYDMKLL